MTSSVREGDSWTESHDREMPQSTSSTIRVVKSHLAVNSARLTRNNNLQQASVRDSFGRTAPGRVDAVAKTDVRQLGTGG